MEMGLFLERSSESSTLFEYKIVATSQSKTMEKELNQAAAEGFRVVPDTFITKEGVFTAEILVVLERVPGSEERFEYKLVDAIRTPTLDRELSEAFSAGYELVAMVTWGEHVVILERSAESGR